MSTPSEQWVVNALRQATDQLPLPPESRWIRERRSTSRLQPAVMAVLAAMFIVAVAGTIGALRAERIVPATPSEAFVAADDAAWQQVRAAMPADVLVLRPALLPVEFRTAGTPECPSPTASWQQMARTYDVVYRSGAIVGPQSKPENSTCVRLEFSIGRQVEGTVSPSLTEVGTISARGTSIRVRAGTEFSDRFTGVSRHLVYLNWTESGSFYEISTFDLDLPTLAAIVRSLEPVR